MLGDHVGGMPDFFREPERGALWRLLPEIRSCALGQDRAGSANEHTGAALGRIEEATNA